MSIRVLLADDHKIVRDGLKRMLAIHNDIEVVGQAENGLEALTLTKDLDPDVVVMDVGMPELGGVAATRCLVAETPRTKVVALSMHADGRYVAAMLEAGASGYVIKDSAFDELATAIRTIIAGEQFVSPAVARVDQRISLQDITGTEPLVGDAQTSVTEVVGRVIEFRDPYTAGHQRRVAELAAEMASDLGMSNQEVDNIRVAALLHDVGKMAVPAEILSKPGALSQAELELVKGHAEAGFHIISSTQVDTALGELIYQHHERCDGTGYPRGLTGDMMLTGAKILAVADVVEAMASHRPYRASLGMDAALNEIQAGAGRLYDEHVVASCVRVVRERGFEFSVAG